MNPIPTQRVRRRVLALLLAAALPAIPASALERGQLADGIAYASGGIGQDEIQALHAERKRYSLWVATVAKPSGAYLSDVRLHIERIGPQGPAFDQVMQGPWFFVNLPLGRYKVTATWVPDALAAAQTQTSQVTIHPGDHHQVVFRFAVAAHVAPEHEPQFEGNPFDTEARQKR